MTPVPGETSQVPLYGVPSFYGITDSGQLAGTATQPSTHIGLIRANNATSTLPYKGTGAWALTGGNKLGQWAGYSNSTSFSSMAFVLGPPATLTPGDVGLVWNGNQFASLDSALWASSHLVGMDANGNIVGTAAVGVGSAGTLRAFRLAPGATADQATYPFGSGFSQAVAVTPGGRILGLIPGTPTTNTSAVASLDGTVTPLVGVQGSAIGMNDAGDIISYTSTGGYLLHNGVSSAMPGLPVAINNAGQILVYIPPVPGQTYSSSQTFYAITSCQPPLAKAMTVVAGSGQTVSVNQATDAPLVVKVTDASGYGAHGVTVNFLLTSGTGSLSRSNAVTEADGTAALRFIASGTPGVAKITASVSGLPDAQFQETV